MLRPLQDYILVQIEEEDTGVVASSDITDTKQYGVVVAVGEGVYEHGVFIAPKVNVGDKIYWEAYAEGTNVPRRLRDNNQALIRANRIMAVEE